MRDGLTAVLMVVGALFMMLAGLGVARLPDLFSRMQAATKSGTVGAGCILLGTAVHFWDWEVASRAVTVIVFLLLTAPVAAHLLARAGYAMGVPLYQTRIDELRERFGRGEDVPGGTSAIGTGESQPNPPGRPPA